MRLQASKEVFTASRSAAASALPSAACMWLGCREGIAKQSVGGLEHWTLIVNQR